MRPKLLHYLGASPSCHTRRPSLAVRGGRGHVGLAFLIAVCVAAILAGSAWALDPNVVPPAGTPDLSRMVLQASDFSHAGGIQDDGYVRPGSAGIVADYARAFGPSTAGRTRFTGVSSEVYLITNVPTAMVAFHVLKGLARERKGQQALLKPFIQGFNQGAGRSVLTFSDFHVLHVHGLRVGARSFILPATFAVKGLEFSVQFLFVNVDRAIGEVGLVAIGRIRAADARTLARAIASHMRSVLSVSPAGTPNRP